MGYYTDYTISIESEHTHDDLIALLHAMHIHADYMFNLHDSTITGHEIKWYEWRDDMVRVSKSFPNWIIAIHGDGEDDGDEWDIYLQDGEITESMPVIPNPSNQSNDDLLQEILKNL